MAPQLIQLIVLAAIAIILIMKLRNTIGKRDGYEDLNRPTTTEKIHSKDTASDKPIIDRDISKYVDEQSESALAFAKMKDIDINFTVSTFIDGAGRAYPMILQAFASGNLNEIEPYISSEVYESFEETISERRKEGVTQEVRFVGLRETHIQEARISDTNEAEVSIEFTAELISYIMDENDNIIDGDDNTVRRQKDVWTFARDMNSSDPNWELVATGE